MSDHAFPALRDAGASSLSRRNFLRGSAAVLAGAAATGGASSLLSGCASGGTSASATKQLTFWNFYGPAPDHNPQSKWFTSMVEEWNRNNDVHIKLRYLPVSEYLAGTALQTAFQAGNGPDIFVISPGDFLRYYNGGVLQDLTPHLSSAAKNDYVPGVLDTRMVDGKVYGLPMEIEPLAMYYDINAFEKAGLSEGDIPTTWDALLNVADKLTTSKRFGVLFETIPGYYQNFTWYPFMWMTGGDAVVNGKSVFDSAGTVSALKLWQDTVKRGLAPRKPQGDGAGNATANLASGFCAMQQTGIWSVSDLALNKKNFKYGVFRLPTPPGGTYTTDMGGWAFVANAKGGNPEAAAKFVTWALASMDKAGVERGRRWNTVVKTNLPARHSVRQAADQHGAFDSPILSTFVNKIATGGRPEPRFPPEVYKAISDAIQACQLNGTDPAQAAGTASDAINSFLKTYDGAPIL
jgi:multiple sugar transport system substrate-binding protein